MKTNVYTDLTVETTELYKEVHKGDPDGVLVDYPSFGEINVTRVEIINEVGEKNLGKPIGKYTTIDLPSDKSDYSKVVKETSEVVKTELRRIIGESVDEPIMVVGLGNSSITADSLGPKVLENIEVTRHLFELIPDDLQKGLRTVSALAPGVLGTTGIETAEIIKGTIERVKPKAIIAVDSLASRKMERIANTVQISNTGISPGAGIGNNRNVLSEETLKVPVIAIGTPTVVSARTLIGDYVGHDAGEELDNVIVTPKEIDEIITLNAEIIATGINHALHEDGIFG